MIPVEQLVAQCSIELVDIRVLLRLTWLAEVDVNASIFGPLHRRLPDVLGTTVAADRRRSCAPLDQLVQRLNDMFRGQREIDLDGQCLAVEIVQHIEQLKRTAVIEHVVHEVHRPRFVDPAWHRQRRRRVAHQALARFDAQIQLQLSVDPKDLFVVPDDPLHVAQIQETYAKSSGPMVIRQVHEPLLDLLILGIRF